MGLAGANRCGVVVQSAYGAPAGWNARHVAACLECTTLGGLVQKEPSMPSQQVVTIVGYLGQEPELRTTQAGNQLLTLNVAVNTRQFIDGNWSDVTDWWRVAIVRRAENLSEVLHKGTLLMARGSMALNMFERTDGSIGHSLAIPLADEIMPLANYAVPSDKPAAPGRGNAAPASKNGRPAQRPARPGGAQQNSRVRAVVDQEALDDLPF